MFQPSGYCLLLVCWQSMNQRGSCCNGACRHSRDPALASVHCDLIRWHALAPSRTLTASSAKCQTTGKRHTYSRLYTRDMAACVQVAHVSMPAAACVSRRAALAHREAGAHSALGHVAYLLAGLPAALREANHICAAQHHGEHRDERVLCTWR